jgi:hypothetical protein
MRKLFKFLTLFVGLIIGGQAWAQHAHCSYGYQDSSCGGNIATAAQTPPQCPNAAGWTTAAAAVWQGSKFSAPQCSYQAPPQCSTAAGWTTAAPAVWQGSWWSAPQCSYQAPPSCPTGQLQQTAPSWNGSQWVGLSCVPSAPTITDQQNACWAAWDPMEGGTGYARIVAGTYGGIKGPINGNGVAATAPLIQSAESIGYWLTNSSPYYMPSAPSASTNSNMFYFGDNYGGYTWCFVSPTNGSVLAVGGAGFCSPNSGAASCQNGNGG